MTPPRPICPGNTHFISRRISQRMFLMRPRPIVEQAFLYVSAIAAEKFNVEVHAMIVMSNHWHALLTDREANLPSFYKYVHMYVSKILNCETGRTEGMWSTEKTSVVTLVEDVDILDRLMYLMANPVAAQLVQRGKDWPGVRRMWQDKNASITVVRPEKFYRDEGEMPAEITLTFSRPPVLESLSDAAASKEFGRLVRQQEKKERKRIASKNGRYMGVFFILRQRLTATPNTYAKKFGLSPRVGGINKWARVEALMRLRSWYQEYREAYEAWRKGEDAEFPYGTYQLKHQARITCAAAPVS
ncbi:MAG: hypothetical protein JKY56_23475 [Kofleriaceae bacterium]|nr:hypothetical protein [Kofleriaceae bacterium]